MGHAFFLLTAVLVLGFENWLVFFHNRRVTEENEDKLSKFVMLGAWIVGTFGGFLVSPSAVEAWRRPFEWYRWLGLPVMLGGTLMRWLVVRQLGDSFSINPGVQPGQRLRTDGFFRTIRHPSYSAGLVSYVGVALVFAHPLTSAMVVLLPLLGILYRIRIEERILEAHFGAAYIEYERRTKKLVPYVL